MQWHAFSIAGLLAIYGFLIVSMLVMLGLSLFTSDGWAVVSASPAFMPWVGILRRFCLLKFLTSSSLFPIPLLLLEMLIAGVVCGVLGFSGNSSVAVAWIYLAIATIALLKSCELCPQPGNYRWGSGHFRHSQPFQDTNPVFVDCYTLLVISMFSFIALKKFALDEPSRQFVMNWLQMRWALIPPTIRYWLSRWAR